MAESDVNTINTDWDVDKYFDETEPEEHWEMRRKFMVVNKNKYSEDYLVALSRVFTNVEFMGCSYNKTIMKKVATLSKGIIEDYREKKKHKLQRTFVKASDAAESRYSGNKQSHATTIGSTQYSTDKSYSSISEPENQSVIDKARSQSGFRGDLILFKPSANEHPYSVLSISIKNIPGCQMKIEKTLKINREFLHGFNLFIGEELICSCFAANESDAKKLLGEEAIKILQKTCFTIERKKPVRDSTDQIEKLSVNENITNVSKESEKNDNIGLKMMKMMGWSGKGLGKAEDGREETVEVKEQIHRAGLGFSADSKDDKKLFNKLKSIIQDYSRSEKTSSLVFSSDFSHSERKYLHQIAANHNLKSRSYGSDKDGTRQLVISKKFTHWQIVLDLLKAGGSSDLYNLIQPTDFCN